MTQPAAVGIPVGTQLPSYCRRIYRSVSRDWRSTKLHPLPLVLGIFLSTSLFYPACLPPSASSPFQEDTHIECVNGDRGRLLSIADMNGIGSGWAAGTK